MKTRMLWKNLTKIAISGSRRFPQLDLVITFIDKHIRKNFSSSEEVILITGNAIGVDDAIETYCRRNGVKNLVVPARWLELDRVAGPRRNQHIVDLANYMFAFWDGESRGTKDAIKRARKAKELRDFPLTIFSPRELRKELGVKKTPVIHLPEVKIVGDAPKRKRKLNANKVREYIADAELIKEFEHERKKPVTKKKLSFWDRTDL